MLYPLSELIDRLSICKLKLENFKGQNCVEDFKTLYENAKSYNFKEFDKYFHLLYDINFKIWKLESDIRKCLDSQLGYEEIGKRAVQIRDYNKIRVSIKNEIVRKTKEGFEDIKINHVSSQ